MDDIQIEQIRFELTWRIRHEVMHPDLPFENIKLKNDKDGIHFGLYAKNQLTSVISLFEVNNIYQFRKFATINAAQGKGYGTKLLEYIIMYVKKTNGKKLWCNARVSVISFYNKFGFEETPQYFIQDDIDFVIMELKIDPED
ncbi:GNAT family N-acetyltransferase [Pedobacter psychroterrae]|uniref:GNAT family N-acetyltransferase n=1 Tax=Pedobacter psychroterrae TaxID=2530453 RepID=A0A4R0NVR9_9SPHI|nr:GNAT family N-acetyltransferase [Pedobacter psychroterrae]TCD03675.1 GNAT family N-acetyltransferase [Pedobacter psychroterrae]